MTKFELAVYQKLLQDKLAELSMMVRNRDCIAIERSADALDEVQDAAERDLAIRNLDRESKLLRHVRRALARVAESTLGVCLRCAEVISPKRLNAVPWTPYCISCQEWADEQKGYEEEDETFESGPATVA